MNIYYYGADGSARRFAEEMTASGTVDAIRAEPGNLRYEYFVPLAGGETVLLIDSWEGQQALDAHHGRALRDRRGPRRCGRPCLRARVVGGRPEPVFLGCQGNRPPDTPPVKGTVLLTPNDCGQLKSMY